MNPIPHASTSTRLLNPHIFGNPEPQTNEQTAVPKGNIKRGYKQPNKTEAEFGMRLKALYGVEPVFEAIKLRIGGNCYYAPDWVVAHSDWRPKLFEVKGAHIWDDSIVKFKAAKERYTWADFELWQKKAGQWTRLM